MAPRLSVILPTFNRAHMLAGAMDSVLAADLDLELIVLDNGSTDGTRALILDRARQDKRVRPMLWDGNNGYEAYAYPLEAARGEFVNFFADDDEMLPGGLVRKLELLESHADLGMVFSTVRCMDQEGQDLGEGAWTRIAPEDCLDRRDLFDSLILGNFVAMPSAMFRRALAPLGTFFRDRSFLASTDWQFWLDLVRRTRVGFLREPTARLRLHPGQVTETLGVRQGHFLEANLRVWRYWMLEHDPPYLPSAGAWAAMCRGMAGALQAAWGADREKVLGGLRRLQALRDEQAARTNRTLDQQEADLPEAFLHDPDWSTGAWRDLVAAYLGAFGPEDPVALILVLDASVPGTPALAEARKAVAEAAGSGRVPDLRVLAPGSLFQAIREFANLQWLPRDPRPLEGAKGRRLAAALQQRTGTVRQ